ncbi:MAG: hypothetical protein WBQ08_00885 [Candidatus Sulfotelmatobacter sp.]
MSRKSNLTGLGIVVGAVLGAVAGVMAGHIAIGMLLGATVRGKHHDCPECAVIHQAHEMKRRNENERLAAGS